MRLVIAVAAFTAVSLSAQADECPGPSAITVTGTVHKISTMREEPQALPETFFVIRLVKPVCGKTEITANIIGPITCSEGDTIEASGAFSPPSKMFDTARLHLQGPPICKAAR